ncbi:hypothetical protein D3C80_1839590 [compost metagenome]
MKAVECTDHGTLNAAAEVVIGSRGVFIVEAGVSVQLICAVVIVNKAGVITKEVIAGKPVFCANVGAGIKRVRHDHMLFDVGQCAIDARVLMAITFVGYRFHAAIRVFYAVEELKGNFVFASALLVGLIV